MFRQSNTPPRIGVVAVVAVLAVALAACVDTRPTATVTNTPYAVLFGHVTISTNSTDIQIFGEAYLDSANALSRDSIFGGFNNLAVNDSNNYITVVSSPTPRKVYFNLQAVSFRPAETDSVSAIPVRLDSLGGGPHDSVEVNFTLP